MHTFNNSTPIQSRRYQTNTKNYFDTFALAYFFALFNSTKISQLIRQYFTFGSFINYERLEESPARKEKSRFSWLQISVVFHREFRHLRTGLQAPAVFCNRHTFPNFLPSTGKPVAGSVLGKILRIAQICNPISQAIVSNDRSLSLIFFARKRTILQISGEVGQAFSCGNHWYQMYHWSETLFSMCGLGFVLEARLITSQSYFSIQCFSEYRIPLPLVENLGTFSGARYKCSECLTSGWYVAPFASFNAIYY